MVKKSALSIFLSMVTVVHISLYYALVIMNTPIGHDTAELCILGTGWCGSSFL